MKLVLSSLLLLSSVCATAADDDLAHAGLFRLSSAVPQTVAGWLFAFKRHNPGEEVQSSVELVDQPYLGFKVDLWSSDADIKIWFGFGKDFKKELPLSVRVSDTSLLEELGLDITSIDNAMATHELACGKATCSHTLAGPCAEFGSCYKATLTVKHARFDSIEWTYPVD